MARASAGPTEARYLNSDSGGAVNTNFLSPTFAYQVHHRL
jgi:hypothetical protein